MGLDLFGRVVRASATCGLVPGFGPVKLLQLGQQGSQQGSSSPGGPPIDFLVGLGDVLSIPSSRWSKSFVDALSVVHPPPSLAVYIDPHGAKIPNILTENGYWKGWHNVGRMFRHVQTCPGYDSGSNSGLPVHSRMIYHPTPPILRSYDQQLPVEQFTLTTPVPPVITG
ncbi:hypothetical protein Bbelb_028630 [Branchiostoma belcheri]|nr:hypothetical protein Bbelb_028630 [Branchiostoma belcheri]